MRSPFPGMDPYIESPTHWSDFHARFVPAMSDVLAGKLPDNYHARFDEQIVLLGHEIDQAKKVEPGVLVTSDVCAAAPSELNRADSTSDTATAVLEPVTRRNVQHLDPHTELFMEIVRLPEQEVVTVLELFSPANKYGYGRGMYLDKRQRLLQQPINIVEIDLIRAGPAPEFDRPLPPAHYRAFISRAERRPLCDVYGWTVRDRLPMIPVPLKAPDPDVELDLAEAFAATYQRGRYWKLIDYHKPPAPAFTGADADWIAMTVASAGRT